MNPISTFRSNMLVRRLKFKLIDTYFTLKDKITGTCENIFLKIKYSSFISNLFFKLNNKTVFILVITYAMFILIQLILFSSLWKPPDISDIPKVKNYLSSYIFKYENINREIEAKLNKYCINVESFAKEMSVPFHLNKILTLQKRIKRRAKTRKDIKTYFIFNHHGRLLNYAPDSERFRNINYKYTPYLKKVLKTFPRSREPMIYFYTDNELIHRKYKFKEHVTVHMLRHTFATELLRCGMSLPGLMKILGHKKITMTLRYTAVTQLDLQKSYYNAIEKANSTDLIPQPSQILTKNNVQANECSYVFAEIDSLIVKIENIRRDHAIKKNKTKIQRITERLRRAQQDLKIILKK